MRVAGLLLAAGEGRRLGVPKALVEYEGELLVERGVRLLCEAGLAPVLVVVGASAPRVLQKARLAPARVVVNDQWREGIGSSFRTGLAWLGGEGAIRAGSMEEGPVGKTEAVVVHLADQPFVRPELFSRLVAAWAEGARAAVATFGREQRNPVLLARDLWDEVASLALGDTGARAYLRQHRELVTEVACDDVGSAFDIDTAEDLQRAPLYGRDS